jgi:hypothetical protein
MVNSGPARRVCGAIALSLAALAAASQPLATKPDLSIGIKDLRIEARDGGGYDLYVRAKPGVGSILLTESTKDPSMKADNFAYRALDFNPVNGNEKRMLNGKLLPATSKLYSLISSTPTPDPQFGQAFRILIPSVLVYGYPWSRSGSVAVGKGTYLNIRAFVKPYGDYSGPFADNSYQIAVSFKPVPPAPTTPPPKQEPPREAPPPDDSTSGKFGALLEGPAGKSLDLVVCLDTTDSMVPYFDDIRKGLGPILRKRVAGFSSYRIGVVLFKDYWPEEYITRKFPFTSDISKIEEIVRAASVRGGGDIPEALYEALFSAATDFDWSADRRQIIFLTDAAPHPQARGAIEFSDVLREAKRRKVEIDAIVEPTTNPATNKPHPDFENARRQIEAISSSSAKPRLLVLLEGDDARSWAGEAKDKLLSAPLAEGSTILALGPEEGGEARGEAAGPWFAARDAEALAAARKDGASLLLLVSTLAAPSPSLPSAAAALSQTVSRLLDVTAGKELARDVMWRVGLEAGGRAEFVNGFRNK